MIRLDRKAPPHEVPPLFFRIGEMYLHNGDEWIATRGLSGYGIAMAIYEIERAAEILDELLDRVEAGETIGITRAGKLVARLVPIETPA